MASTIKVDNVQNQPGTNVVNKCGTTVNIGAASDNIRSAGNNLQASDGGNLISQSGTTITLGASGDTINLACGASQTGFGRTGTVDWDTSIKTGTVTAVTGKGYFVDTTSGGITVNLPAAAVGSIVAVSDYASTSASNNITISPNGSEKINAVNDDYTISTAGLAVTLVYADAARGWKSVTGSDADATGVTPTYIVATGGNQPTAGGCIVCTNFKVHKFTGPGTFCVSAGAGPLAVADYMVVAGGAGGGAANAGGGGGGGYRGSGFGPAPLQGSSLPIVVSAYPIDVGGGGAAATTPAAVGVSGSNSVFSTITSAGGGGGASQGPLVGADGGSGGGGSGQSTAGPVSCQSAGGAGDTPPTPVAQGTDGGFGISNGYPTPGGGRGGGGGGSCAAGSPAIVTTTGGVGGAGATNCISGSPVAYAGGGGGSGAAYGTPTGGAGGAGGGGAGGSAGAAGTAATVNTGGGGGGGYGGGPSMPGGAGGSGIVWIRYRFQA